MAETISDMANDPGPAPRAPAEPQRTADIARLDLTRLRIEDGVKLDTVFERVTETAADILNVERVGVWLMVDHRRALRCINLYERSKKSHSAGVTLQVKDFPDYFAALERRKTVPAEIALTDPRTVGLSDAYLVPLGVTSMLDAPIFLGGEVVGVLCHEHIGPLREWTTEERDFAGSMADLLALKIRAATAALPGRRSGRPFALLDSAGAISYSPTPNRGRIVRRMYAKKISEIENLIRRQDEWRCQCINLIASENVMSHRARAAGCSDFAHRYAEGHPGERYYRGTSYIDEIESQLKTNLKIIFECDHCEVRPISGTNANEAVFSRFVAPGDVVMVNSTPGGGHISHHRRGSLGKFTGNIIDFPVTPDGYRIDVEKTAYLIEKTRPKLIVVGKSLFLFPEPVAALAEVCRHTRTLIMYDAAHVLGLIAGKHFQRPLAEGAWLMTASTHKTFFGSQRGVILSNMEEDAWRRIDRGAFPGSSSNHHLDTLAQMAICAFEMMDFGETYAEDTIRNAKSLAAALDRLGFDVQGREFGYTDSHQVAVNVKPQGGGEKVSRALEANDIILNMNMLPHEPLSSHDRPDGIRIGVQEMTRFGMGAAEMERIAELIHAAVVGRQDVKEDVNRFRSQFREVRYSYDNFGERRSEPLKLMKSA